MPSGYRVRFIALGLFSITTPDEVVLRVHWTMLNGMRRAYGTSSETPDVTRIFGTAKGLMTSTSPLNIQVASSQLFY